MLCQQHILYLTQKLDGRGKKSTTTTTNLPYMGKQVRQIYQLLITGEKNNPYANNSQREHDEEEETSL